VVQNAEPEILISKGFLFRSCKKRGALGELLRGRARFPQMNGGVALKELRP
jgi:hypothetical protein